MPVFFMFSLCCVFESSLSTDFVEVPINKELDAAFTRLYLFAFLASQSLNTRVALKATERRELRAEQRGGCM